MYQSKIKGSAKEALASYERKVKADRRRGMALYAKEREAYYLRVANRLFEEFIREYGKPAHFDCGPPKMIELEQRMDTASGAGDVSLTTALGDHYLDRVRAYLDGWRKHLNPEWQPPEVKPDPLEIKSTRIPKNAPSEAIQGAQRGLFVEPKYNDEAERKGWF